MLDFVWIYDLFGLHEYLYTWRLSKHMIDYSPRLKDSILTMLSMWLLPHLARHYGYIFNLGIHVPVYIQRYLTDNVQ